MAEKVYLAVDLGASSGRVVAGRLRSDRIELEEVYRFPNGPVRIGTRLHWNLPGLWLHVQQGLRAANAKFGNQIVSLGVDTWGVDYGLLGPDDELLGNPYHYRDPRTRGIYESAFALVPRERIFAETGLQFMELNTLYQLFAARLSRSPLLDVAESMLLMPDLFHWLLTGRKTNERTNVSTTQLYNPQTRDWSRALIDGFDLPAKLFGEISEPGTRLGKLLPEVAAETGLAGVEVVLPASHDTASAVVAVPAKTQAAGAPDWCYISSGTWALMGIEAPMPVINDEVARWNFTNEAGVAGTTRLLKNIAGLWLVQECRRVWQQQGRDFGWDELAHLAAEAPPLVSMINPDDPRLAAPTDMPQAIAELCRETGQPVPQTPGATLRCALESIAARSQQVLASLETLNGHSIETIHMVGGGTQNELLCQLTADACERPVVAGPVEATALGNILVQAWAMGEVSGLAEARQIVRQSFELKTYEPRSDERWASVDQSTE